MKLKYITAWLLLLLLPVMAKAGVSLENGNFFITYADIKMKADGHELAMKRTYNSMSSDIGWFGYGWGTMFETRLIVLPDGSAAVKENGSGRNTYYRNKEGNDVKAVVNRIVGVATKRNKLTSLEAAKLAYKLTNNEDFRLRNVLKYGINTKLPDGAVLADECGDASLKRVSEGFERYDCNRFGDSVTFTDTFDLNGRLIKRKFEDGYMVSVRYVDPENVRIFNSAGQSINLKWAKNGHVASVKTDTEETKYEYDANHNLTKAINSPIPISYRFTYDENHNLTRITYVDNTSMNITYSTKVVGVVSSVVDTHGDKLEYAYRNDPDNPDHSWVKVTATSSKGEAASKEYEIGASPDLAPDDEPVLQDNLRSGNEQQVANDNKVRVELLRSCNAEAAEINAEAEALRALANQLKKRDTSISIVGTFLEMRRAMMNSFGGNSAYDRASVVEFNRDVHAMNADIDQLNKEWRRHEVRKNKIKEAADRFDERCSSVPWKI